MEKEINCEFGAYLDCGAVGCDKPATYTYRDEGRVWHFCKEHYGDIADDGEE
jgi:hypothetical protein